MRFFLGLRVELKFCRVSQLDSSAFVKAKINNSGVVALGMGFFTLVLLNCIYTRWTGYTQTLRPGVKASFGVALDTQKLNDPAPVGPSHKVRSTFLLVLEFFLTMFILHRSVSALCLIHESDGG